MPLPEPKSFRSNRSAWSTRLLVLLATLATTACGAGSESKESASDSTEQGLETTLIAAGDTWKYLDNGSNQGTAWRATTFG